MLETFKKAGFWVQNNPRTMFCIRFKILQLLIQSILALVTGVLSISNRGQCSVPINVFLLGLFGSYITAIGLNFIVCSGRCCENYCSIE